MENRPCTSCKGSKRASFHPDRECPFCDGLGEFQAPDKGKLLEMIKGRKGLKSVGPADARGYYVWRMARFNGGKDVSMPVLASVKVHGDPFIEELNTIAEEAARIYFGSDEAGVRRWGRALGIL